MDQEFMKQKKGFAAGAVDVAADDGIDAHQFIV